MLLRFASALPLLATTTGPALSPPLDTGHHSDLTRSALIDLKFSDSAIKAVQVANWLTDFYSGPDSAVTQAEFEKLHADCLFSTADVTKYWKQLAINTKNAVGDAARGNDEVKFLTILGLVAAHPPGLLHAFELGGAASPWRARLSYGTPGGTRRSPAGWTSTRAGPRTPCIRAVPRRPRTCTAITPAA